MSRQTTMTGPWAAMAEAAGGVGHLAEILGVTPMTIWRWANGGTISPPVRIALATVAHQLGVQSPV